MTISRTAAAIAAASLISAAVLGAQLAAPVQAATPAPTATASPVATPVISYPTTTAPGTVTKATILTGDRVGFSGAGFMPGSPITISISLPGGGRGQEAALGASVWGTIRASGSGTFSIVLRLTILGVTTLTATGINPDGSPRTVVSLVTVLPRSKATTSASPSPSSSTSPSPSSSAGSSGAPTDTPTAIATGTGDAGGGGGSGNLPKTGADGIGPELWLGGGLLALGGAALLVSVSRRRTRVPD